MVDLFLGIDAGNHRAKVAGPYGIDSYRTAICDWFERHTVETHGEDDMEFCIDGRKGFAGSIAVEEDEFGGVGMYGDSKAHEDTKIRVLLAIHRYIEKYCPGMRDVSIVTGQPIATHNESEKKIIRDMLQGTHKYTVNGVERKISINRVGVSSEGGGAFWACPEEGLIRIIDVGSGTVNSVTVSSKKFINNASGTFNFGMETVSNKNDLAGIARGITKSTTKLKWKKTDKVLVCGGSAKDMLPFIASHYSNAKLLQPLLQNNGHVSVTDPVFANAVGFYKLALGTFK